MDILLHLSNFVTYEYLNLYYEKVSIHCKTITIPGMSRIRITPGIKIYNNTPHSVVRFIIMHGIHRQD